MTQSRTEELRNRLPKVSRQIRELLIERESALKATKGRFNLLTLLLSGSDETRLHSRFIGKMINPKGDHDCEGRFLDLWLDSVRDGIASHLEHGHTEDIKKTLDSLRNQTCRRVLLEHHTPLGNIDIFIEFDDYAIAIENKIWAQEQQDQIARYVKFIKDRGRGIVLYLTLDGKASQTAGKEAYYAISYGDCVLGWIDKCLSASYEHVHINSAFQQYRAVVRQLTHKTLQGETLENIKNILRANSVILEHVRDINRAVDEIRGECVRTFLAYLNAECAPYGFDLVSPPKSQSRYTRYYLTQECWGSPPSEGLSNMQLEWTTDGLMYIGIGVHRELDKRGFYETHKDNISRVRAALGTMGYQNPSEYWPAGTVLLSSEFCSSNDRTLAAMMDEHTMRAAAAEMAASAKQVIEVVRENWRD